VLVGFQVVNFDGVVLAAGDALHVGVVPEDGDGAAGVQCQLVVPADLDQLGRLRGLAFVAGLQVERIDFTGFPLIHGESYREAMNSKNEICHGSVS